MSFYVYLWEEKATGRMYVGRGTGRRARAHLRPCATGFLAASIRARGKDAFRLTYLATDLDHDKANELESYFILALDTRAPRGFNLTDGGDGCAGWTCSEETLEKRRRALTGKRHTNAARAAMSKAKTGRKLPPRAGKFSEETRRKMSEAAKRRKRT